MTKSHDVTPWYLSASCDVRYDHIRFAAEALKLRDKVRVGSTDVLGDWRVFWVKLEIPFTFRSWWISKHMTHEWLMFIYVNVTFTSFVLLNSWIRFVYAMIWVGECWFCMFVLCLGMASIDALWNVLSEIMVLAVLENGHLQPYLQLLHIALLLVIEGESNLYLRLAKISTSQKLMTFFFPFNLWNLT